MPTASPDQLVTVLLGLSALMGFALMGKKLFFDRPTGKEYVTRAEFETFKQELLSKMTSLEHDTKTGVIAIREDLGKRLDKVDSYQREVSHRLADAQQAMALNVQKLLTLEESRERAAVARHNMLRHEEDNP